MKKQITLYLIALIITLTTVLVLYFYDKPCKCESILPRLEIDYRTLQGQIDNINIDKALLDRIDELTRYIERLEMENAAQKDYINGFENKFWKEAGE